MRFTTLWKGRTLCVWINFKTLKGYPVDLVTPFVLFLLTVYATVRVIFHIKRGRRSEIIDTVPCFTLQKLADV